MSKTNSGAQRSACPTLLHAEEAGVANQVLLQGGVEGTLMAQPGKSTLGPLTQMDLRKLGFSLLGRAGDFHFDFDQVGARAARGTGFGIQTAGGDQLGLGQLVGGEESQDGGEVLIGEFVGFTAKQPANIAAREAGPPGDVALIEMTALGLALEGSAEITHGEVEGRWLRVDGSMAVGGISFLLRVFHYTQHFAHDNRDGSWVQMA